MAELIENQEVVVAAGRIVFSDNPGGAMKAFRMEHGVKQIDLARQMQIGGNVISDYEAGRRPCPGVVFVRRYVLGVMSANGRASEQA